MSIISSDHHSPAAPAPVTPAKRFTLTHQIFVGLFIGIVVGAITSKYSPESAEYYKPFSDAFMRMIKMIIAPLVFSTLVVGIAGAGQAKTVGRMGLRAFVYFYLTSLIALVVGLVMAHIMAPGEGVQLPPPDPALNEKHAPLSIAQTILHIIPTSLIQAMAEGEVLQIVFFAILFALAINAVGERAKPILNFLEAVAETMFKVTNMIMLYAPIGVGAAIAYVIGHAGLDVLGNLVKLVGTLYLSLAIMVVAVLIPSLMYFKVNIGQFFREVREPALLAFSTSSSEAAFPKAMLALERLGAPRHVVSFVLPLGYSFNLLASTLHMALCSMFIAQAAGIHLSVGQQVMLLLTLMVTSKGVAGVSRASLIVLSATLPSYNLPLEGITVILGVDAIMDMARSAVNVTGNCVATMVVARWEGYKDATTSTLSPSTSLKAEA